MLIKYYHISSAWIQHTSYALKCVSLWMNCIQVHYLSPYKSQIKAYFPLAKNILQEIATIVSETDYAD